jgi:3-hydroxyacyl-[acyl-carrier-protein] dehydratase
MLDIEEIKEILPHRYPFLMIDKVIEINNGKNLIAVKNVSIDEYFFEGHFPKTKVMPGVLIIEAMAQSAIIFFYYSKRKSKDAVYYLGKVESKFYRPVLPGDQLVIEVTPLKLFSDKGIVRTEARVQDRRVAIAEIAFSVKD